MSRKYRGFVSLLASLLTLGLLIYLFIFFTQIASSAVPSTPAMFVGLGLTWAVSRLLIMALDRVLK